MAKSTSKAVSTRSILIAALRVCESYFSVRADAECERMMLALVRDALKKASA